MPPPKDSLIQECPTCGALIDVSGEEPFSLMHCPTCGAAMRIRRHFDQFEIQEELGAGGMGTVYRATDTNLHREVALKLLQRENSANPEFIAQFEKEAAITASINHPHVVKVYSTGRDHGLLYIAMELVDQGSLESLMHAYVRVPELQVLSIGIQIAQGLTAALERGLIHRDIKPGNILFANPTTAKMVDFGLAVLAEHAGTVAGEVWATPYYVAPEVAGGQKEDFRTDLYSLGATLYHALAGRPPHAVETNSMSALAEAKKAPVNLQKAVSDVSSATAYALNRALSHEPEGRQASYAEFIEHLEFARAELIEKTPEKSRTGRSEEVERTYGWLTALTTAVVVITGVLGYLYTQTPFFMHVRPIEDSPDLIASDKESVNTRYDKARKLLASGDTTKAAEAFARLDALEETPQPLRNWITLQTGLAQLLDHHVDAARASFATLEKRGVYSSDPAEAVLGQFFIDTARTAGGNEPIPVEAGKAIDVNSQETIGLFIYGIRDWTLGAYDECWQLLRQYSAASPQGRDGWVLQYKPLSLPYLGEINAFRAASAAATTADTLETRKQALLLIQSTKLQLKLPGNFPTQLDALAKGLQEKVTAEEDENTQRMTEMEAADAKTLEDAKAKATALWQQFRPGEAAAVYSAASLKSEKAGAERTALAKKMQWLAKFKATLIADINAVGYAPAVPKRTGVQMPGPVRRANEAQIETVTPFGSLPAPWTDIAPEGLIAMGKSFLRPDLPPDPLADRQWVLGVYSIFAGRVREGRDLLVQAAQTKAEYRDELALFLETTSAP